VYTVRRFLPSPVDTSARNTRLITSTAAQTFTLLHQFHAAE
jgi:hypothetical protein